MAVFDIRSNLLPLVNFDALINSDGTVFGAIVDNAANELGLMFAGYDQNPPSFGRDGTHIITFQQSGTGAFAGEETVVPQENLIGDDMVFDGTVALFVFITQGIFGTLRFVRPVITSTGTTNGIILALSSIEGAEQTPVIDDVVGD